MFQTILLNTIIWLIICKISFFCSKFTTIAQYAWFQNAVFVLENFAEYKLKSEKLAKKVLNWSYSKAFSCRPCHCFWISFGLLFFALRIESMIYALICAFILGLFTYLMAKGLDVKEQNEGTTTGAALPRE